jgi:STE24 endopeptidase
MLMGLALMVVVGPPVVAAIIIIVQKGGPYLALYLWAFMLLLSLVLMAVYPILIAPLFNKFTPVSLSFLLANFILLHRFILLTL